MSQQYPEHYDPRKDPSFMDQGDISPGKPYDPGPRPPVSAPLRLPQQRERLSRTRAFFRRCFFGNTTPGTNAGRRTAFKRGLVYAMLLGLIIATPFAIVGLIKGTAVLAVVLPAAMIVLGCVFAAGIAMCIYSCCVQLCNRRRRSPSYDQFDSNNPNNFTPSSLVEQDVNEFTNDGSTLGAGLPRQYLPTDAAASPYYSSQPHPTLGQPVPGYTLRQPPQGSAQHNVADEFGLGGTGVNAYDL